MESLERAEQTRRPPGTIKETEYITCVAQAAPHLVALEIAGTPSAVCHVFCSGSSVTPWSTSSMYLNSPAARTVRLYLCSNSSRSMSITSLTWKPETSDISDRGPRAVPSTEDTPSFSSRKAC